MALVLISYAFIAVVIAFATAYFTLTFDRTLNLSDDGKLGSALSHLWFLFQSLLSPPQGSRTMPGPGLWRFIAQAIYLTGTYIWNAPTLSETR